MLQHPLGAAGYCGPEHLHLQPQCQAQALLGFTAASAMISSSATRFSVRNWWNRRGKLTPVKSTDCSELMSLLQFAELKDFFCWCLSNQRFQLLTSLSYC